MVNKVKVEKSHKPSSKAKVKSKLPAKKMSIKMSITSQERENCIRDLAFLNWLNTTGGAVVGDDQTRNFWLNAEAQFDTLRSTI